MNYETQSICLIIFFFTMILFAIGIGIKSVMLDDLNIKINHCGGVCGRTNRKKTTLSLVITPKEEDPK